MVHAGSHVLLICPLVSVLIVKVTDRIVVVSNRDTSLIFLHICLRHQDFWPSFFCIIVLFCMKLIFLVESLNFSFPVTCPETISFVFAIGVIFTNLQECYLNTNLSFGSVIFSNIKTPLL